MAPVPALIERLIPVSRLLILANGRSDMGGAATDVSRYISHKMETEPPALDRMSTVVLDTTPLVLV